MTTEYTKNRFQKLAGILKENLFDAEDLFGDIKDVPEKNPARQTIEDLDRDDKFTIGNRKPVYRVIGPTGKHVGATMKPVVIDGSAERKYYILKVVNADTFDVGAFEAVGGTWDTVDKPHRGKTGPVVRVGAISEGYNVPPGLVDADKLPNIGPDQSPQQDVMPKVQVLEELEKVLGEVLSETADEAWYQGAKYLADALKDRIEGL